MKYQILQMLLETSVTPNLQLKKATQEDHDRKAELFAKYEKEAKLIKDKLNDPNVSDEDYEALTKQLKQIQSKWAADEAFVKGSHKLGSKSKVTESKNETGDSEYTSYTSWKRACKKKFPDVWFDGDEDISNAMVGPNPYVRGKTKGVGEWDGASGIIYNK